MTTLFAHFDPPIVRPSLPETDVAYVVHETPIGRLLLAADDSYLLLCVYAPDEAALEGGLQRVAASVSPRILRGGSRLDEARRQLDEYLAGRLTAFALPTSLALASAFQSRVLTGLRATGYGATTTYGALAAGIDQPRAARAVGTALGANPLCLVLPCHRVLPAGHDRDGVPGGTGRGVGGYAGGPAAKESLLRLEREHAQLDQNPR